MDGRDIRTPLSLLDATFFPNLRAKKFSPRLKRFKRGLVQNLRETYSTASRRAFSTPSRR